VEQLLPQRQVYRKRPFMLTIEAYLTAIKNGQLAVVKLFKASGCDLNLVHGWKPKWRAEALSGIKSAVRAACAAGHLEVIRVVCRRLDWPAWKSFASLMLVAAAQGGHVDIVNFVIGHIRRLPAPSVTSVHETWFLCGLFRAALCGRVSTCLCLLDAIRRRSGVDADLVSKLESALWGATSPQELVRVIQALDDHCWNDYDSYLGVWEDSEPRLWQSRYSRFTTDDAFVMAAKHGQLSIVRYYLECGQVLVRADRDAALRAAEQGGHSTIVQLLRARGAKLSTFEPKSQSSSAALSDRNEREHKVQSA